MPKLCVKQTEIISEPTNMRDFQNKENNYMQHKSKLMDATERVLPLCSNYSMVFWLIAGL